MPHLVNHQQFQIRCQTTPRTFVITGTGTAALQVKLGGKDDPDEWIVVEDADSLAPSMAPTAYAVDLSVQQIYRFEVTGDSTVWIADPNLDLMD